MAIKHNPYGWEIRPKKEPIEDKIKARNDLIKFLYLIDTKKTSNRYLSTVISDLYQVQQEIDDYYNL